MIKRLGMLMFILMSCEDDSKLDSKIWSLNMAEHFNTTYPLSGTIFKSIRIDDENVLINEYSPAGSHLLEVNFSRGEFGQHFLKNYNVWDMKRSGDEILLASATSTAYKIGVYNKEVPNVDFFSEADRANLNDPPDSNAWTFSESYIYTFNPNITPTDESEVYISKWNLDGSLVWRSEVSPMNAFKIANIPIAHNNYVVSLTVSNQGNSDEKWGVGKLSSDGELVWHRQFDKEEGLWQITEDIIGNIFAISATTFRKMNSIGAVVWSKPLSTYVDGFVWSQAICTSDGGIVFVSESKTGNKNFTMVKVNADGNKVWELKDVNGIGVSLLELPDGNILATSLDGFIIRY